MVLLPKSHGQYDLKNIKIVSRGFVFMKEADEVVQFIKMEVAKLVSEELRKKTQEAQLKNMLEKRISRRLYKVIRREPMIVVEIFEV
jgi:mRNA degradation ribonuclease J1/J2